MPLVFPEEQYNVKNLGDFWLNCADASAMRWTATGETPSRGEPGQAGGRSPPDPDQRSRGSGPLLVDETDRLGQGLVLFVDNLDIVLDRLNEELRNGSFDVSFQLECPGCTIIGASSRALEVTYEHGRAFYDYFQVYDLKRSQ